MGNVVRSPRSPQEGTLSMLLSRDIISEIRKRGSPSVGENFGGKSSRNRTWPTRHHSTRGKRCEREDVGENLPCRNQRVKPTVPMRRVEQQQFPMGPSEGSVICKIPSCFLSPGRRVPLTCLGEHRSSRN